MEALESHQPSQTDDRYQQLQLMLANSEARADAAEGQASALNARYAALLCTALHFCQCNPRQL